MGIEEVNWFGQVARPCIDRINEPIKSPQTCMYIIGGGFWNTCSVDSKIYSCYSNLEKANS